MNARVSPIRPGMFATAPPAPPIGAAPRRYGNGRVEIQIYPAATTADRLAAARLLLDGTPWRVALDMEETR
jgi:hypothetical protein